MHTPPRRNPIARPLPALTVVLLLLLSPTIALMPVAGVHTGTVDGQQLPMVWNLGEGGSATFDVTLPVGDVTEATLGLEGSGVELHDAFEDTVDTWTGGRNVVSEGVDLDGGSLRAATQHMNLWEGGGEWADGHEGSNTMVGVGVTLGLTSPRFVGSGGGFWKHYIPVDISLNTGKWEHGSLTFLSLDIPPGRCKSHEEVRIADPDLREVPLQVIGYDTDASDGTLSHVELLLLTDMPPEGARTYRVYYDNPVATPPGYRPLLLGAEMWEYNSMLDPNFIANWKNLRWTGGNGAGWAISRLVDVPGDGKLFEHVVTANPGETYSQVWTSANLKNGDFQLTTHVGGFNHEGPQRSSGMWALDFRVSGNDCYRLAYSETFTNGSTPRLTLLRVSSERHLTDPNVTGNWRVLDELSVGPMGSDPVPLRIRANGPDIDIWVGDETNPALRARDNTLAVGEIGTFVGAEGNPMVTTSTQVSCWVGPILIMPPDVNLTSRSHTVNPGPQRQQHFTGGQWTSGVHQLEGARDCLLSIDVSVPPGSKVLAQLVDPTGASVILDGARDGSSVPEGLLDGGFRLRVMMELEDDSVTPALRGWGVGYRAVVNPGSERLPASSEGVVTMDRSLALQQSRDVWNKQTVPVLKPGNIPEDEAGVSIGSVVPFGNGYRVYYTGKSSTGRLTICVAISQDGETFTQFIPVVHGSGLSLKWDAVVRDPVVVHLDDVWLMYFIGELFGGRVGLALSGDGLGWTKLTDPVLTPSGVGWEGSSILDCSVILHENLFMMYYTAMDFNGTHTAIGYAFSYNGATWTKSPNNPVLKTSGSGGGWDSGFVRSPWVVPKRDQFVMYFVGGKGSDPSGGVNSVGYAVSPNGLDFKAGPENPVLVPRVGALTDDFYGIRRVMVMEEDDAPYLMLYTGQGEDLVNRVFKAESGHVKVGTYVTKPFVLPRAPSAFAVLDAALDAPDTTAVSVSVRTSPDGNAWTPWRQLVVGEVAGDLAPETHLQLSVNLSSDTGRSTPRVHAVLLDYVSNVRHSSLTVFPVTIVPETIVSIAYDLQGEGLDGVEVYGYLKGMDWDDITLYTGHARYGQGPDFGYRLNFSAPPAGGPSIASAAFSLGWISLPSEVGVDVGDDGSIDAVFEVAPFEGFHELSVTGPTRTWMDAKGGDAGELTITFRVHTATPGVLNLTAVSFLVDTRPRVTGASPDASEVSLDEGKAQTFSVTVLELDGDELTYQWYLDGDPVATTATYTFHAEEDDDSDDPAPVSVEVVVSDGTHGAPPVQWTVSVRDTTPLPNVPPFLDSTYPTVTSVTIDENTSMRFSVYVVDPDLGPQGLSYTWSVNGTQVAAGPDVDAFDFEADFDSAGTYTVLVEVTDGEATVDHSWDLTVKNVVKPGPPGDGDGGDEGGDDVNWLPVLLILIIVGVLATGGVLYMRGQRAGAGAGTVAPGPEEVVTAEVPEETPLPVEEPSFTETASLGRDVAAGPGAGDAAKAASAVAPAGVLPLADLDKDRTFVVEEVYVVYNDGRLMCHQARAERTSVDTDLFGGMFTAIQQFIHDSMGGVAGTGTQVGRLDYGENRILVERGNHIFLAAIIFGEEQESLREAMRDVINRVEGSYAGVIERWSGDQTLIKGVSAFITPLLGLTQDLNREAIMSRTRTEGVKMLSEVEFFQGFVRLKVAVRNDTRTVITNVATDIVYDSNVLRLDRIQPDFPLVGTKANLGTIGPREKKTVAYYLDPLICQESDIDGTTSFKDAEGAFGTVTMKRRRADIVCPIFFTEENANTAMLKRLIHEELRENDSKLFSIPKMLAAPEAFALGKQVIRSHDVRFVREFVEQEEDLPYRGEAWYYGVTKVKRDKMVIRTSIWEDRRTIEFFVAAGRMESITGLLAELGQNLNAALKERYLGRVSATLVVDPEAQEEVKGLGLLIDKYSEGEMDAGEVEQHP